MESLGTDQVVEDADDPAWSLFNDREAIEKTMTTEVRTQIAIDHGVKIPQE